MAQVLTEQATTGRATIGIRGEHGGAARTERAFPARHTHRTRSRGELGGGLGRGADRLYMAALGPQQDAQPRLPHGAGGPVDDGDAREPQHMVGGAVHPPGPATCAALRRVGRGGRVARSPRLLRGGRALGQRPVPHATVGAPPEPGRAWGVDGWRPDDGQLLRDVRRDAAGARSGQRLLLS